MRGGGGGEGRGGRVDSPCSSRSILLRKETNHTNFALDIFLGITPILIS